MLGSRKGNTGVTLRALEEAPAVLVVAQQVDRRRHGAVTEGTAEAGHCRISRELMFYPVYGKQVCLSPGQMRCGGECRVCRV